MFHQTLLWISWRVVDQARRRVEKGGLAVVLPADVELVVLVSLLHGEGLVPRHDLDLVGLPLFVMQLLAVEAHLFVGLECLGAKVTLERALIRVCPYVVIQQLFGAQPFFAYCALKLHCRRIVVYLCKVLIECRLERQNHTTNGTGIG